VTGVHGETPAERLARWTAADAAIGLVAQVEADNAELRRTASRVSPLTLARRVLSKVYRRARSAVTNRLPR
jgi:hypothetical protein